MTPKEDRMRSKVVSTNKFVRLLNCIWKQKSKTRVCPMKPLLTNKIIAITGGNRGIGLETTKGLIERGAEVIILSRGEKTARNALVTLKGKAHFVKLDLADINTFGKSIKELKEILKGRKIDTLINNAGIALNEPHRISPQGYELTFAINVLGHHVLFKKCHSETLFAKNAQIIAITGDVYVQADNCTPDYVYSGKKGWQAYSRSKLGVMWWAFECKSLYPNYKINIVHPGAVLTQLGGGLSPTAKRILGSINLLPQEGAQTTLICATQAGVESGEYYHNTVGKVLLPENDIALNKQKSREFWKMLEEIYQKNNTA